MTWDGSWNNSILWTLQQCAEKFRRKVLEGERALPSLRMPIGTVGHRIATEAHKRQLMERGQWDREASLIVNMPGAGAVEEARDLAASEFDKEVSEGVQLAPGEDARSVGRAKDSAIERSAVYVRDVAPTIEPIAVERRIVVQPQDSNLKLHGRLDLIARERVPASVEDQLRASLGDDSAVWRMGEAIRDQKFPGRSPNKNAADVSQQLTMYSMLRWAEVGALPDRVVLDHVVQTPKTMRVSYVSLSSTRSREDVVSLVQRINTAVEAVDKGVFVPTNPDNWWCSRTYCEFFSTCRYVNARRDNEQAD